MSGIAVSSQLAIVHRVSRIVSSGLKIDEMLRELVAITVEVTLCDACLVYLPDHATGEVVLRASQLPHSHEIGQVRLKIGEGITGWVAEHKSVVALAQSSFADKRFKRFTALVEDTYEAFLSIPLVNSGEVIGVLNAHHREPHLHSPEEIALLSFLGEQMGGVIAFSLVLEDNSRLQEETLRMKELFEVRKIVERAKGVLQARYNLTEKQAYERLRDEGRRSRKPMRSIAEAVLTVDNLVFGDRPLMDTEDE
jgi:uroporphyrinogen-III synthase